MTERIQTFLAGAGFAHARLLPLAGDASIRRYLRLVGGPQSAILMEVDPGLMDVRPFLRIAAWLRAAGYSAPEVLAAAPDEGLVLLEDLGDASFSRELAAGADPDLLYGTAVELLVDLQRQPAPPHLPPYDDAKFLSEAGLLIEWFAPGLGNEAERDYTAIWQALLPQARVGPLCLVYVDYHADNLHWLPGRTAHARVGLLDFQDARLGGLPAYDLVSLLEDARRDVPPELARRMIERYLAHRPELDPKAFRASYAILGAQRNAKILGLFTRLAKRDGKPRYLGHVDRVQSHFVRDLTHPALVPLRAWCARFVPALLAP